MIIKFYELNKIDFNKNKLILFYGKNEGLKNNAIENLIKDKNEISYYDEKIILEDPDTFIENIFNKSLFEKEKIKFSIN